MSAGVPLSALQQVIFALEGLPLADRQSRPDSTRTTTPAGNDDLPPLEVLLSHFSSDAPRGNGQLLGPDGQPVEGYWLGVLLAAKQGYGPDAEAAVREWSKASDRYSEKGFNAAWDTFDENHPNPVRVGSLIQFARAKGWAGSSGTPASAVVPNSSRYTLLNNAALHDIKPIAWRLKSLVPELGIGAIFGPSGSAKSFLVINMAMAIARGEPWFGFRAKPGPVTYVMLEGEAGLRNRILAFEKATGLTTPDNFFAIAQPFNLTDPQAIADLGAVLPKNGVLFIDTMNQATPGSDENSGKDMGVIIAGLKQLQEITGGFVVVVHHTGKDTSRGIRGHSSLHAALDCAIEVTRDGDRRAWRAAKVKDGSDGLLHPFRLEVVHLGIDEDGDPITSCAALPSDDQPRRREPSGGQQKTALGAIRELLNMSSEFGKGGASLLSPCVRLERDAVPAVVAQLTIAPGRRTFRARELIKALIHSRHLRTGNDALGEAWLWIG